MHALGHAVIPVINHTPLKILCQTLIACLHRDFIESQQTPNITLLVDGQQLCMHDVQFRKIIDCIPQQNDLIRLGHGVKQVQLLTYRFQPIDGLVLL